MVLKIVNVPRSTYYYQKNYRVEEKQVSEGRPAPGYSIMMRTERKYPMNKSKNSC
ncbi:hypothetical protein P5G51_004875 [Virgibacillus sp. 179-BFC.A HS]|uniref:Transposase n=1 Tax=Tigheibacillus jepli TaxID=3035914 RepID=A0ABU5CER2_9BACI|nr:hypothetical protein [Virgibacillus sp. 179-BFC.A HS]MDY0404823.1 hypothetical protein [Virgibacillus sp. 179-BFC.A HS]